MKGFYELTAEVDFNRNDDKDEFGIHNRIIGLNCFEEDGISQIGITLKLGRKDDDSFNLTFDAYEFINKLARTMWEHDA